jgi:hypothetical protein
MTECVCHLGEDSDHQSRIDEINSEIERIQWAEPVSKSKQTVVSLMEEYICIRKCIGEDTTEYEEKLTEYQEHVPIRRSTQPRPRKRFPGTHK